MFFLVLAAQHAIPLPGTVLLPLGVAVLAITLFVFSREVIDLQCSQLFLSALAGIGVFVIWILPDILFPGYRQHWLFQNPLTGAVRTSLSAQDLGSPLALVFRSLRAVALVPIIEELFWRAWLMRWLISPDFERVPLGAYGLEPFTVTAVLFACEHGPYWDVGLAAGLFYNWWMVRTRSLGDCILAHAVTNACLCGYVIATHHWEYWL
jgi:CAAX prenyl protease-like protein